MLKLPRISPASVMAAGALFLSAGGGVALAATQIDGHTVTDRSLPGTKVVAHTVGYYELTQPKVHLVGTPGSAAFDNGWVSAKDTDFTGKVGYEKDGTNVVRLTGEAYYPGASQSRIFTLPAGYRPAKEKIIPVAIGYHLRANVVIGPDGGVDIQEKANAVDLDSVSFIAGT